jgi:RecA/RadA recombinase
MWDRGWARGRVDNIVGDKSAGKSALALEAAANFFYFLPFTESLIWPKVVDPIVVYNNPEGVMDFPLRLMFGDPFVDSLEMIRSPNVQHMGRDFIKRATSLKTGKKTRQALLYIVDTWDFLRSAEQLDRFNESIKSGSDMEGSYDGEKQKWSSGFFAKTSELMSDNGTDATLIIVSQIRKVMNATKFQKQSYRTGGKAFDHAMHQEAWIREARKNKGTKFGEERIYSIDVAVKIEKNKTAKPYRQAEFTILYDYGIDDLTSCFKYAVGIPSTKSKKKWRGQEFSSMKEVIAYIERKGYENKIRKEAAKKFRKVEKAFSKEVSDRKTRWDSPITS